MTTGETSSADGSAEGRLHPYFREARAPLYKITQLVTDDGHSPLSTRDLEHVRRALTPAATYRRPRVEVAERVIPYRFGWRHGTDLHPDW